MQKDILTCCPQNSFIPTKRGGNYEVYLQQNGAPSHYSHQVCRYLNQQFTDAWIGQHGPVALLPDTSYPETQIYPYLFPS